MKSVFRRGLRLLVILVMSAGTLAIWHRNHDILRDIFDYSTVITAAGKVEAGLKPYTGVRSPMQSSVYLLNYWTEQLFGRNYLALTLGGLMQALGGGLMLLWVLHRRLGVVVAALAALAVTMAGLLQHVVFFYNPIGILCLGLVVLGLAVEPSLWPVRTLRTLAILGALFLGGINKLSFHGATLALGGLLTVAAWAGGRITRGVFLKNVLLLAGAGLVLPLAFELAWTGATISQWWADVVLLPQARQESLGRIFDVEIYVRPVYESHHHILVPAIAGIGLLLLVATGGWLLHDAWRNRRPPADWVGRGALLGAGCVICPLLMITSHETVLLTSLSYPILATAVYLLFRNSGQPGGRWLGHGLVAAGLCWSIAGGYAAWHGSRVLYAPDPPPRSAYVRLVAPPRALNYFDGVRMLPDQIDALERTAARLASFEDAEGKLTGMLFGPALEWMERAYPEAIVRRSPIWYDAGTSLGENDVEYFRGLLAGGTRRLITHKYWQAWPLSVQRLLEQEYRPERVGSRDVLYHPRGPAVPAVAPLAGISPPANVFRSETASNILLTATRFSEGMRLRRGANGTIFGATGRNSNWSWPLGANDFQARAVARLRPAATSSGTVTFRVIAGRPDTGELLWETAVTVNPRRREVVIPLSLQPGGQPLWLQTVVEGSAPGTLISGWRDIRISHATESDRSKVPPFGHGLQAIDDPSGRREPDKVWYARDPQVLRPGGWIQVPAENWRWFEAPPARVRVEVEFDPNPADPADPVVVTLAWYRAGRFEKMTQRMINLQTTRRVTLEAQVTESVGWVGLLTRPAGGPGAGHTMKIVSWEAH